MKSTIRIALGLWIRERVSKPDGATVASRGTLAAERRGQPQPVGELGYLGLIADDRRDRGRGVRIMETQHDGPAERSGLRDELPEAVPLPPSEAIPEPLMLETTGPRIVGPKGSQPVISEAARIDRRVDGLGRRVRDLEKSRKARDNQ